MKSKYTYICEMCGQEVEKDIDDETFKKEYEEMFQKPWRKEDVVEVCPECFCLVMRGISTLTPTIH